jgi:hypothetical protein
MTMTTLESQIDFSLAEQVSRYYADPPGFVLAMYPWRSLGLLEKHNGPDDWQREFLVELGQQVAQRASMVSMPCVPSAWPWPVDMAWASLLFRLGSPDWIMSTRPRAKGTITANTFQQLSTRTWAQLTQWTKLCFTSRWFTLTTDQMYYRNAREAWFVSAQSCKEENSEAFAGQHAADSTSFYIFDEASGVPDKIFEVAEGGLTDGEPMIFLFGNPTRTEGKFFRVNFGSERERWEHRSVDSVSAASLIRTSSNSGFRITARIPISAGANQGRMPSRRHQPAHPS